MLDRLASVADGAALRKARHCRRLVPLLDVPVSVWLCSHSPGGAVRAERLAFCDEVLAACLPRFFSSSCSYKHSLVSLLVEHKSFPSPPFQSERRFIPYTNATGLSRSDFSKEGYALSLMLRLPTAKAEGFLQSFGLSPSCDGASSETYKTFKPTNSG